MILDIIIIILFALMLLYGYKKGCIGIVAKLVSMILALVIAYLLAGKVATYIEHTSFGKDMKIGIETKILNTITNKDAETAEIQEHFMSEHNVPQKIIEYVFIGIGFAVTFVITRLVLWLAEKILESIFELPVLKTFNKLGGILTAGILFVIELNIFLAVIKSLSTLNFMNSVVNIIGQSVITKAMYNHNIFTSLILSKVI